MILFPLIHVGIGVGLTYYVICSVVNTTTILVSRGVLSLTHGPLWWPGGSLEIPTSEVDQLYCTRHVHRHKNSRSVTFTVNVLQRDQISAKLLSGLNKQQALYIEQTIEDHLKIEDVPVDGEIK